MTIVLTGLAIGSIYALVGLAYNVVFVATGVFNFAQAQLFMVGTFVAYLGAVTFHLPIVVTVLFGAAVGGVLGGAEEILAIRPLAGRSTLGELITTVGIAVLLEGVVAVLWGPNPRGVPFAGGDEVLHVLGGRAMPVELSLVAAAVVGTVAIEVFRRKTLIGAAGLATSEDREAAMLRGINVRALSLGAFVIAGAAAGALGFVVAPQTYAVFDLGNALAIAGFVAIAIGGFGSFGGALIGGLSTGIVEAVVARYLGENYQNLIVFGLLVVLLLLRPTGIFGSSMTRTV